MGEFIVVGLFIALVVIALRGTAAKRDRPYTKRRSRSGADLAAAEASFLRGLDAGGQHYRKWRKGGVLYINIRGNTFYLTQFNLYPVLMCGIISVGGYGPAGDTWFFRSDFYQMGNEIRSF